MINKQPFTPPFSGGHSPSTNSGASESGGGVTTDSAVKRPPHDPPMVEKNKAPRMSPIPKESSGSYLYGGKVNE